jgi:hypothetical protein
MDLWTPQAGKANSYRLVFVVIAVSSVNQPVSMYQLFSGENNATGLAAG